MIDKSLLISKGYFPKELPPLFTTDKLGSLVSAKRVSLDHFCKKSSKCIIHNIPKIRQFSRSLSIPNPLHQMKLVDALSRNWPEIQDFFSGSELSLSIPVQDDSGKRAVTNKYSYDEMIREKVLRSCSSKYMVSTDISRFYRTIYTHSIPWALHGKSTSKSNRSSSLLGNLLDFDTRNTQDQQTLGIPIGPDTSRIISELIAVAIDCKLQEGFSDLNGIRYVDDFFFFVNRLSDAEKILDGLNRMLKEFELEVNELKTDIQKLPQPFEPLWMQELRSFRIRSEQKDQATDLLHLFSRAFVYYEEYTRHNVLHFAIIQLLPIRIYKDNWSLFESLILQSLIAEPRIFPIVTRLFVSYKSYDYPLSYDKIKETLLSIINYHVDYGHGFVLCWAFWLLREMGITVDISEEQLSSIKDPFAVLSLLYLRENGFLTSRIPKTTWQSYMKADELYLDHWLLSFEALERKWLNNRQGNDYIAKDDFFLFLRENDISFLNMEYRTNPIKEKKLSFEQDLDESIDLFSLLYD